MTRWLGLIVAGLVLLTGTGAAVYAVLSVDYNHQRLSQAVAAIVLGWAAVSCLLTAFDELCARKSEAAE